VEGIQKGGSGGGGVRVAKWVCNSIAIG